MKMIIKSMLFISLIAFALYLIYKAGYEMGQDIMEDHYTNIISIQEQKLEEMTDKYRLVREVNDELRQTIWNMDSDREGRW